MRSYDFTGYTDSRLEHDLSAHTVEERERTALILAEIAEFSHRKLYAPAGFSSMWESTPSRQPSRKIVTPLHPRS